MIYFILNYMIHDRYCKTSYSDLTFGVLKALMALHVGVYPDSLVLPLSLHHVRVGHVMLVVAPDKVVYWCLVQHGHHAHPLQLAGVTRRAEIGESLPCLERRGGRGPGSLP